MSKPSPAILSHSPEPTPEHLESGMPAPSKTSGPHSEALLAPERYKRVISPKTYIPSERTSTMSFKAPMSEARKLALLEEEKKKQPPGGFYGAVSYITAPVWYIGSLFKARTVEGNPKKTPQKDKSPLHSPKIGAKSVKNMSAVQPAASKNEMISKNHPGTPNGRQDTSQVPVPLSEVNGITIPEEPEPPKMPQYAVTQAHQWPSRENIEAKKEQALKNIKQALYSRKEGKRRPERPPKNPPEPVVRPASPAPTPQKIPQELKIRNTNKYAYRITSKNPIEPAPRVTKPAVYVNRPKPPPPIRVVSNSDDRLSGAISYQSNPGERIKRPHIAVLTVDSDFEGSDDLPKKEKSRLDNTENDNIRTNANGRKLPKRFHPNEVYEANRSNSASSTMLACEDTGTNWHLDFHKASIDLLSFDKYANGLLGVDKKRKSPKEFNNSSSNGDASKDTETKISDDIMVINCPKVDIPYEKTDDASKLSSLPVLTPNDKEQTMSSIARPIQPFPSKDGILSILDPSLTVPPPNPMSNTVAMESPKKSSKHNGRVSPFQTYQPYKATAAKTSHSPDYSTRSNSRSPANGSSSNKKNPAPKKIIIPKVVQRSSSNSSSPANASSSNQKIPAPKKIISPKVVQRSSPPKSDQRAIEKPILSGENKTTIPNVISVPVTNTTRPKRTLKYKELGAPKKQNQPKSISPEPLATQDLSKTIETVSKTENQSPVYPIGPPRVLPPKREVTSAPKAALQPAKVAAAASALSAASTKSKDTVSKTRSVKDGARMETTKHAGLAAMERASPVDQYTSNPLSFASAATMMGELP